MIKIKDVLTWDLEAMSNCRQKINEGCRLLMLASTAIADITIPSGEEYYNTTFDTMVKSIRETGQTLLNIRNALLNNELELENAEKANEQIINEILDKYFNEGWNIGDILAHIENGDKYFRDDITYDAEIREFGAVKMGLVKPSSANDGEAKPLVIFLPGWGGVRESENSFLESGTAGVIKNSGFEKFDGYTACLYRNNYSIEQITEFVDELSKECNIDKSNIILAGYSQGAVNAAALLEKTDYFSQGILISVRRWGRTESSYNN